MQLFFMRPKLSLINYQIIVAGSKDPRGGRLYSNTEISNASIINCICRKLQRMQIFADVQHPILAFFAHVPLLQLFGQTKGAHAQLGCNLELF